MKKYCFTQCFKTKAQRFWGGLTVILSIVLVIAIAIAAIMLIVTSLGLIAQAIYMNYNPSLVRFIIDPGEAGLFTIVLLLVLVATLYLTYLMAIGLRVIAKLWYRGIKHLIMAVIGKEKFECKIFEECK